MNKCYLRFGYKQDGEIIITSQLFPSEISINNIGKCFYKDDSGKYQEVKDIKIIELNKKNLERLANEI